MRYPRALPFAVLILAAACGRGSNGSARPVTMLDATTHDVFFPISAGSKHALGSDSPAITCNSCHGGSASFKQFDCLSCHQHQDQATLTAGHRGVAQFAYDSASCYSCHPRGTSGGAGPSAATSDHARSVTVNAEIPSYVDTSISNLTPQTEILPMPMLHASPNLAAAALASCGNCHANAGMGTYYPGDLHLSLAALNLGQPSACRDCHAISMPTGLVGPTATSPARTPASSEMKHDAVLWSNGAPIKTSIVTQDCSVCHVTPTMALQATWATSRAGATPALFHASLTAANLAQPASCVDCHANSRPAAVLTSATAALPANVQFDHSAAEALGDCTSCHLNGGATQWSSWSGGQFHLANSANPTSCLPCHANERPTSTSLWVNKPPQSSPFDYVVNSLNVGHGADQDCATCHAGPGTGVWGGTGRSKQNWVGGTFTHGASTISGTTCFECHSAQRPDLVYGAAAAKAALPTNFDHSLNGTGDCFGCHQATVQANTYVSYWDGKTANSSDWKGGVGYPGSTLISAPGEYITPTETTLHRSGPNNLVTSTSSIIATLNNAMLHTSTAVPWSLGTTSNPTYTNCYHCHTASNTANGSPYANGKFHSALTAASLPQPTGQCSDCHSQMRPANIVQMAGSDLQPMDHSAAFVSPVTINGQTVSSVNQMECSTCHTHAGTQTPGWADGAFHANIGAAVPADCTTCHYPLMADTGRSDLSSGTNYAMKHASSQITFQNCQKCHAVLSKGTTTPIVSTLWNPGAFHASLSSQPTACLTCHSISEPAANASTQSSWSYTFANGGGTSNNQAQWMNHGAAGVSGKDCFTCHAADAKHSGSAWSKATYFHSVVTSPTTCQACHGLTNGGGSVGGTNNNLPAGLTNSGTLTMASNDASTGVPVGTHDQINHADINVSSHDCNFCHTQAGISTAAGVQGQEWAQAIFHAHFTGTPLILNATTGRCSNCHMNVKPGSGFSTDHSAFTSTSGSEDCATCHAYPGTGTPSSPNWYGASGVPAFITVGGFTIPAPPAASATIQSGITNLPHPTVTAPTTCSSCHTGGAGGKDAIGYDHASTLASGNCGSCHEAGTNLVGVSWNGTTVQASGAGDSRPFTISALKPSICGTTINNPGPHFYPSDCSLCHSAPTGIVTTTTGATYTTMWKGRHPPKVGSTSSPPCSICHQNGCN